MSGLVRPPRVDEAIVLADLHVRTWEETFAGVFPPSAWGEAARAQRINQWAFLCGSENPSWTAAVAEWDGEVVGIAFSGPSEDDPPVRATHLFALYVLRAAQGRGLGQALFDQVVGSEPASLWHLEHNPNPNAFAFYLKNGFAPDGARKSSGYPDGGDVIRLVR